MLSIVDCVNGIKHGRKTEIKAQIIQNFYGEILSNAQINKLNGTIDVQFEDSEFDLALEATKELLDSDYHFKRYVTLDDRFLEDEEITLEFNLEHILKPIDNEIKVCNNYCEDDIPF